MSIYDICWQSNEAWIYVHDDDDENANFKFNEKNTSYLIVVDPHDLTHNVQ